MDAQPPNPSKIQKFAHIKKNISHRCNLCGGYVKGDPYEHIRLVHGGKGAVESPGSIDYVSHPVQIPSVASAPATPVNQLIVPPAPMISNPFTTQYSGDVQGNNQLVPYPQNWSFQHPVIVQRQRNLDVLIDNHRRDLDAIAERGRQIEEEQKKIIEANEVFKKSGGVMQPINPDSFEAWKAAFAEITGLNFGWGTLIIFAAVVYAVLVFFDVPTKIMNLFTPVISVHGRRLVEERGQYVNSVQEYMTLAKAEWKNVHQNLQLLDALGNSKILIQKLRIKTHLMDKFVNSTLDGIYIILHKASDSIEQCRSIAAVGRDKNAFTDSFIKCIEGRLF